MPAVHQIRLFKKLGIFFSFGTVSGVAVVGVLLHESSTEIAQAQMAANLFSCESSATQTTYHLYAQKGADELFHGSFSLYDALGGGAAPENGRMMISSEADKNGGGCIVRGRLRGAATQMDLDVRMVISSDQLKEASDARFIESSDVSVNGTYAGKKVQLPKEVDVVSLKGGTYVQEKTTLDAMNCHLAKSFVSSLDACKAVTQKPASSGGASVSGQSSGANAPAQAPAGP